MMACKHEFRTTVRLSVCRRLRPADMHCSVDKFATACTNVALTISTKKNEVLNQPAPGKPYVEPNITVNGQRLNAVNRLTYLGSTTIDDEVNVRIAKPSAYYMPMCGCQKPVFLTIFLLR